MKDEKEERIGLFGGTFDPVHAGHLAVAKLAAQELLLDWVIFIPAADPPHKKKTEASHCHRVAMLEAALAGKSSFDISLLEAELPAPSYTVDTLLELRKRLAQRHCSFYFILGADSLLDLHCWYRYQDLLRLTKFIVITRPGISAQAMHQAIESLPGDFLPDASQRQWRRADGASFFLITNTLFSDISSSALRRQLRHQERPDALDQGVLKYIAEQGLYQG